ncbi:MAG: hypothetical protein KDC66_16840 [Phaeodactylibacter sp.]|nr:hypothetical protein [Phaeodactylibacter sp.]MCB9276068.1 restriction endonuclease [Lewinellaceae bacterium]
MSSIPPLIDFREIQGRLELVFPEGIQNRNYLIRELAAKTIFVMLYTDAIEGKNHWIRPNQVTRMTDEQAAISDVQSRKRWTEASLIPSREAIPGRWFAHDTREPIRDETLRYGFIEYGAVIVRQGIPTTSSKPRYSLQSAFSKLFSPDLTGVELENAIKQWQNQHLSPEALARTRLVQRSIASSDDKVLVTFPNQETRRLSPGPSSVISKAVIEVFAKKFLAKPGVIWLSESGNKVVERDEGLARSIGISISSENILPDIILVDLGRKIPIIVFVEVVATDGPIDEFRKKELGKLAQEPGFAEENIAFVTAYLDRGSPAFQKTFKSLAWNSFAWLVSEPDSIISLYKLKTTGKANVLLYELLQLK